jgi:hypothetical protein
MDMEKYKELIERWPELGIIEQPPAVIETRNADKETIVRYRFVKNKVLEYVETDYKGFPLIFVGGNSVLVRDSEGGSIKEYTRSYIHNAIGVQKIANVALQSAGSEMENMVQHKFIVAKEAIPEANIESYTDYQVPSVMLFNAFLDKEGVEPGTVPLPPPREIVRQPMPPEILNILQLSFQLFQNILGSFDASLGINNNQLSGVAIVEGATQSNSAAMPFIVGYINGLNRLVELWIDLFPKYYITPRTIPIVKKDGTKSYQKINVPGEPNFKYGSNDLNVKVEAGPNYSIQKSKTLQLIMGLSQSMPIFAQFVNSSDILPTIIKLLELPGAENLQEQVKIWVMQQKQAQQASMQQGNPAMMKMQLEQQNLALKQQQMQVDSQLKAADISTKHESNLNERMRLAMEAKISHEEGILQLDKHNTEKTRAAVDLAISVAEQQHRRQMDHHGAAMKQTEFHHKIAKDILST